ncbi:MAG TPA: hypothetical protein VLB47_12875, partial [Solirubrobacteraceae bacterium]|nr:hypothetical protein [Solirubrobacteraceae bacterium]
MLRLLRAALPAVLAVAALAPPAAAADPAVTFTGLLAGDNPATSQRTFPVTFTVPDGDTATCSVDDGVAAPCSSPVTVGPLADGLHVVKVVAAPSSATAARSVLVDASAPVIAWLGGPI